MMNERIKQIAEQSGLAEAADVRGGYIYPVGMEKFAKLMILEVLEVIQNQSMGSNDEWETGLIFAENAIKEHFEFGVEE